jgi:hypothetical protein
MAVKYVPFLLMSLLVGMIIDFLVDPNAEMWYGVALVAILAVLMYVSNFGFHYGLFIGLSYGNLIRSTCSRFLYSKILRLSNSAIA